MAYNSKIVLVPHIGTAYGHLIRVIAYCIKQKLLLNNDVYIIIPESSIPYVINLIPKQVRILNRKTRVTINSPNGVIDFDSLLRVHHENNEIIEKLKPDLIIDSPGISGGIIGYQSNIEYEILTHGCYLELPNYLANQQNDINITDTLTIYLWKQLRQSLNHIIQKLSFNKIEHITDIFDSKKLTVPADDFQDLYCKGNFMDLTDSVIGFDMGKPAELLITSCSDGNTNGLPMDFLKVLYNNYKNIFQNVNKDSFNKSIYFNNIRYDSLVDNNTTVITHGGFGTLQMIKKANRVFILPGDLDQLYNSLIAKKQYGFEILLSKKGIYDIISKKKFTRTIDWDRINAENIFISKIVNNNNNINSEYIH